MNQEQNKLEIKKQSLYDGILTYSDMIIYEVVKIKDTGSRFYVEYITTSTLPWTNESSNNEFLPCNPLAAEAIREAHRKGKDVYIQKNWNEFSKEVLVTSLEINNVIDLTGYKRRAKAFIKSYINPIMASVHASVVYGFTTLNNKFIERGYVFSEQNKSLKYIAIMEDSDNLLDSDKMEDQKIGNELMEDLELYIEYKEILDRSNFVWNLSEKYLDKIDSVQIKEYNETGEREAKEIIDSISKEFQHKINSLNNLK